MRKRRLWYRIAFVFLALVLAGSVALAACAAPAPTTPKPTTPTAIPTTSPTAAPTTPKPTASPTTSPAPTATAKPVTWRLVSDFPLGTFVSDGELRFMDEATKRSNGLIKFDHFPGASLYKSTEIWKALQDGRIECGWSHPTYATQELPILDFVGFQLQFVDEAHAQRAIEGDWGKEFLRITEEHFTNIKLVGFGNEGAAYAVGKGNPILVPSDMKARKMRTTGGPMSLFFESQGATVIQMSSSELSMAFERGTIDATLTTITRIVEQFKGIVDWVVIVPWVPNAIDFISVSRKAFNALTPELQKVVLDAGQAAQAWGFSVVVQRNKDGVEQARTLGMKIYTLTPEQIQQWFDACNKYVIPVVFKDYGPEADKIWALAQKYK